VLPNVGAQVVTLHYPDDPATSDVTRAQGNFRRAKNISGSARLISLMPRNGEFTEDEVRFACGDIHRTAVTSRCGLNTLSSSGCTTHTSFRRRHSSVESWAARLKGTLAESHAGSGQRTRRVTCVMAMVSNLTERIRLKPRHVNARMRLNIWRPISPKYSALNLQNRRTSAESAAENLVRLSPWRSLSMRHYRENTTPWRFPVPAHP
jgi:hypothetical protein